MFSVVFFKIKDHLEVSVVFASFCNHVIAISNITYFILLKKMAHPFISFSMSLFSGAVISL